jgi:hypothetical protein
VAAAYDIVVVDHPFRGAAEAGRLGALYRAALTC